MPPTRIWLALLFLMMPVHHAYSQHLGSARGVGMAAFTAYAADASALDWNPAGIVAMTDWEISSTSALATAGSRRGISFQTAGIGKRFMDEHAAAVRLSPGALLEFVLPTSFVIEDSANSIITTFDKKIRYEESFAAAYGFRASDQVALGLAARFIEESVTDTKYSIDTSFNIYSSIVEYTGSAWAVDGGVLWTPAAALRVGVTAKNLLRLTETQMSDAVRSYRLAMPKSVVAGIGYTGVKGVALGLDGDTEKRFRAGAEWHATEAIALRGGTYVNGNAPRPVEALALGAGISIAPVRVDIGYLAFLDQSTRAGKINPSLFDPAGIGDIEFNEYTSDRLTLTASLALGRVRESLVRIEYVEMIGGIYPSSQPVYAFRPVGRARVSNVSAKPVEVKVSFYVDRFMDAPTESKPSTILPGETLEIPFFAVFNDAVRAVSSFLIRDGDVYVAAAPAEGYDDHYQTRIIVHGRNDWNGDVTMLRYFLTPEDPEILAFSRAALGAARDTVPAPVEAIGKARRLFDAFARSLMYVNDPKASQDYVQYPSETLRLRGGDCDDMAVCYATLLASAGYAVAFVDVIPPESPADAHVYLMFDSGVEAAQAHTISDNPKRYVVRKNETGKETAWIPVETTVVQRGFDESWSVGARSYFEDAEVKLGVIKGWVRVVDVPLAW